MLDIHSSHKGIVVKDILDELEICISDGVDTVVATVVSTWGSAPRSVGSSMAITSAGGILGSVSGGCVEGAVVEIAKKVLTSNKPELIEFGVADEDAWEVGLACGGTISVFLQILDKDLFRLRKSMEEFKYAVLTVVEGPSLLLGRSILVLENGEIKGEMDSTFNSNIIKLASNLLDSGSSILSEKQDGIRFFVEVNSIKPILVLIGGVHIAVSLSKIAKIMGYHIIVVDPRRAFGNEQRFPNVDRIIHEWPDVALEEIGLNASTAVAVLTHDPKIDDLALLTALSSEAFYVGALGSKKTNELRNKRLLKSGLSTKYLDRLSAPIGLDIGGKSPEEIALAVMAEIVSTYYSLG